MQLVRYIYGVQGFEAHRLDYAKAAKELHADWRTISRWMTELADAGIISFCGNTLCISEDLKAPDPDGREETDPVPEDW